MEKAAAGKSDFSQSQPIFSVKRSESQRVLQTDALHCAANTETHEPKKSGVIKVIEFLSTAEKQRDYFII